MTNEDIIKKLTDYSPDFKTKIEMIHVKKIEPNEFNPRKKFGQEEEDELIESINSKGVLQPIIVFEKKGNYVLLDGQRRVKACKKIGIDKIPAHIITKEPTEWENLSIMFHIHNVHEDWTDLAIAKSLQNILRLLNINSKKPSKEDLKKIHKVTSFSYYKINKYLDVLKFPKPIIDKFFESELKEKPDLDLDLLAELRKPIKQINKVLPALSAKFSDEKIVDIFVNKKKDKIITSNRQIRMLSKIVTNVRKEKINKVVAIEKISEFFTKPELPLEQVYSDTSEAVEQAKLIIRASQKLLSDIKNIDLRKIPQEDKQKLLDELKILVDSIKRKFEI